MMMRVTVKGLPPKKDGANSMWTKAPEVTRLISLRAAVAKKLGDQAPLRSNISVSLTVRIPENGRHIGDLDNMVTGVLDGLQTAHALTPWNREARWSHEENTEIRPDTWAGIVDDVEVDHVTARKVVTPGEQPSYTLELRWERGGTDAAWLEAAKTHLLNEVIRLRSTLRFWLATHNANRTRWFGGSAELHGEAAMAIRNDFLMSLRRLTDTGSGQDFTIAHVLRHLKLEAEDEVAKARFHEGLKKAKALRFANPDVVHLRNLADKVLAHANPVGLEREESEVEGLDASQFNVAVMARAAKAITDIYCGYVEPTLVSADASYLGDDVFRRKVRRKGLPVLDYAPPEVYSGHGDEDWSRAYVTVEKEAWLAATEALPRPWPPGIIEADARVMSREAGSDALEIVELAERWGISEDEAFSVLMNGVDAVFGAKPSSSD